MRLHDRIGESYFMDPETHEIKKVAAWVRFKGTHQHVQTLGALSRTRGNFSTTQVGSDLLRKDLNEDWRLVGGIFFGNLYGKTKTKAALDAFSYRRIWRRRVSHVVLVKYARQWFLR